MVFNKQTGLVCMEKGLIFFMVFYYKRVSSIVFCFNRFCLLLLSLLLFLFHVSFSLDVSLLFFKNINYYKFLFSVSVSIWHIEFPYVKKRYCRKVIYRVKSSSFAEIVACNRWFKTDLYTNSFGITTYVLVLFRKMPWKFLYYWHSLALPVRGFFINHTTWENDFGRNILLKLSRGNPS